MQDMFRGCESFNQDIFNWNVSKVENMDFMFDGCKLFNCDLSKWNVYNVTDRNWVFNDCPIEQKFKPKFK
jgi:surface protein